MNIFLLNLILYSIILSLSYSPGPGSPQIRYFRGEYTEFEDCVYADNAAAPLWGFNVAMRSSASIGWTRNAQLINGFGDEQRGAANIDMCRMAGALIYDGPVSLEGLHIAGLPSKRTVFLWNWGGSSKHGRACTPSAIKSVGAARRFFG